MILKIRDITKPREGERIIKKRFAWAPKWVDNKKI